MYHLMKSEKFTLDHMISGFMSSYRHTEIRHFRQFRAALKACEDANNKGTPNYYIIDESGQEYYDGAWVD